MLVATFCAVSAAAASTPRAVVASTRDSLLGVGSASRCESGQGEACEALADGNEYVRKLQERSRLNRAKYEQELFDKTVRQLGYSEYFDAIDKNLVQLPDGKYALLTAEQYSGLRKAGKMELGSIDKLTEVPDFLRDTPQLITPSTS